MELKLEVENIGSLRRDLGNLRGKLTKKDLIKYLKPGAAVFRKAVRERAPVGKGPQRGALKRAIRVRTGRGKATDPSANVQVYFAKTYERNGKKTKPFYAMFVQNGTSPRFRKKSKSSTGQISPNPFVYDAFEAEAKRVADMILSSIEQDL